MRKPLPIGYDSFSDIINRKLTIVDKTLFIKDLLDDEAAQVSLITRPRRFGKTLNLSMLQCFFAAHVYGESTEGLFEGLAISRVPGNYMQYQGKYPVMFVTFKGIKDADFEHALSKMALVIKELYGEHRYLLLNEQISLEDKIKFQVILEEKASQANLENSLQFLTKLLYQHHGVKPWLLIDEYDSPIHAAYLNGYYKEMISFMRSMFGDALKTNRYLERAVITGILRVSKESLFSGLNNIKVYTVMDNQYSQYFGFTEEEVDKLLIENKLESKKAEIQAWYNGYQMGNTLVYNPWSIANCLNEQGKCSPFWLNTSDNGLIKQFLAKADESAKLQLDSLLKNEAIEVLVDENIVFGDLSKDTNAFWSLLLFSGYLKPIETFPQGAKLRSRVLIPNREVLILFEDLVVECFTDVMGFSAYLAFLSSLVEGRVEEFTRTLKNYLLESASVFDIGEHHPERFYHGFVMGLIVSLRETHYVESNKESGFGRYDVMLIPKDASKLGIIFEFKVAPLGGKELVASAQDALNQIFKKEYAVELKKRGITQIMHMGLAFKGKEVEVMIDHR